METIMKNDLAWEHPTHNTFTENCSSCWAENVIIKSVDSKSGRLTNEHMDKRTGCALCER